MNREQLLLEEPDFKTERELEDAVGLVAQGVLQRGGADALVLRGFGLDLAVFAKKDGTSIVRFFEVKSFAAEHGRCGFGNQEGEGNQIRLLFDIGRGEARAASVLRLFDPTIRWILGDRSRALGVPRFVFFTCEEAQAAAMNGVRPGKQNNFRLSAFGKSWITWRELIVRITDFVLG
jgi:hypothetical protein